LEGPTMVGRTSGWKEELGRFLKPFLVRWGHKAWRQMCPLYVSGLIGPGDRISRWRSGFRLVTCRAGDRRHGNIQERHAFGGFAAQYASALGKSANCPDPGVFDIGAR
jgi:hypothetical protein